MRTNYFASLIILKSHQFPQLEIIQNIFSIISDLSVIVWMKEFVYTANPYTRPPKEIIQSLAEFSSQVLESQDPCFLQTRARHEVMWKEFGIWSTVE